MGEIWRDVPDSMIVRDAMEQAARVADVPASIGWSDVGDWHGLGSLLVADEGGIAGFGTRVALLGTENLIVVETLTRCWWRIARKTCVG